MVHSIVAYCSGLLSKHNIVLCALNSIAPLVDVIEFRVRSSSSSAYMFAPKPDPVRLKSKRMEFL